MPFTANLFDALTAADFFTVERFYTPEDMWTPINIGVDYSCSRLTLSDDAHSVIFNFQKVTVDDKGCFTAGDQSGQFYKFIVRVYRPTVASDLSKTTIALEKAASLVGTNKALRELRKVCTSLGVTYSRTTTCKVMMAFDEDEITDVKTLGRITAFTKTNDIAMRREAFNLLTHYDDVTLEMVDKMLRPRYGYEAWLDQKVYTA